MIRVYVIIVDRSSVYNVSVASDPRPCHAMSYRNNLSLRQMLSVAHLGSPGAEKIRGRPPNIFGRISRQKLLFVYEKAGAIKFREGRRREAARPPIFAGFPRVLGLSAGCMVLWCILRPFLDPHA